MLTADELARYKTLLTEQQRENDKALADLSEACEPVDLDLPIGRLTRNDAMQDQQTALYLRRQRESRRTRIGAALARIASDKFGICLLCKAPIDTKRLDVAPESPLCVPCLEKETKKKALQRG